MAQTIVINGTNVTYGGAATSPFTAKKFEAPIELDLNIGDRVKFLNLGDPKMIPGTKQYYESDHKDCIHGGLLLPINEGTVIKTYPGEGKTLVVYKSKEINTTKETTTLVFYNKNLEKLPNNFKLLQILDI